MFSLLLPYTLGADRLSASGLCIRAVPWLLPWASPCSERPSCILLPPVGLLADIGATESLRLSDVTPKILKLAQGNWAAQSGGWEGRPTRGGH